MPLDLKKDDMGDVIKDFYPRHPNSKASLRKNLEGKSKLSAEKNTNYVR